MIAHKLILPVLATLALGACAQAPAHHSKETMPMNASAKAYRPHTLDEYPDLTPEEMGRRMLKLIDSLASFDELSLARVQEVMRLPLYEMPSGTSHAFGMHLPASDWYYAFDYYDHPQLSESKNITYEFLGKNETVDMGPVCAMDYGAYVTALTSMGFQEREDMARYDALHPYPRRNERTGLLEPSPPLNSGACPFIFSRAATLWCRSSLDVKPMRLLKSCLTPAWNPSPPSASERDKPCPSSILSWRSPSPNSLPNPASLPPMRHNCVPPSPAMPGCWSA